VTRVLLDTDVLIDHLNGSRPISPKFDGSGYSSISRAELYSWSKADESVIDELLDQFEELPVDRAVAEEAGRIRRIKKVRMPDALIAATAITWKAPLFTRNRRDFQKIKRLRLHS
jgi:predicted nucleic acid-binding protein